jgi:hypothetical protein
MCKRNRQIARQVGQRTGQKAAPQRGPRMHAQWIPMAVAAAAAVLAISRPFLRPDRSDESIATDLRTHPGFAESDAERRERSP